MISSPFEKLFKGGKREEDEGKRRNKDKRGRKKRVVVGKKSDFVVSTFGKLFKYCMQKVNRLNVGK